MPHTTSHDLFVDLVEAHDNNTRHMSPIKAGDNDPIMSMISDLTAVARAEKPDEKVLFKVALNCLGVVRGLRNKAESDERLARVAKLKALKPWWVNISAANQMYSCFSEHIGKMDPEAIPRIAHMIKIVDAVMPVLNKREWNDYGVCIGGEVHVAHKEHAYYVLHMLLEEVELPPGHEVDLLNIKITVHPTYIEWVATCPNDDNYIGMNDRILLSKDDWLATLMSDLKEQGV